MKKEEVLGVEESLKTTADALKKQLKDEAHARTVLQVSLACTGHQQALLRPSRPPQLAKELNVIDL